MMQKTYTKLVGLGLVMALTFGVGFKLGQHREVITAYTQASSERQVAQKAFAAKVPSKQVATILLMPKSYVPLLEKFKHRKIARAINFIPAHIGWDDGQMVAIPKRAVLKDTDSYATPVVNLSHRTKMAAPKTTSDKSKMTQGAAFLFLLKGAVNNKFRYTAGQSTVQKARL